MASIGLRLPGLATPPGGGGAVKTMARRLELRPSSEYSAFLNDLPDRRLRDKLDSHAKDHRVLF
jgi:hypothetical protein